MCGLLCEIFKFDYFTAHIFTEFACFAKWVIFSGSLHRVLWGGVSIFWEFSDLVSGFEGGGCLPFGVVCCFSGLFHWSLGAAGASSSSVSYSVKV